MKVSIAELTVLLNNSVVEIKFKRRKFKPGWSMNRRMLCTNNGQLLNSVPGRIALNFKPPTRPPPYNASAHNLVIAWDLFWQQYRAISLDYNDVVSALPVVTEDDRIQFWQYFNGVLQEMSSSQKTSFMNS